MDDFNKTSLADLRKIGRELNLSNPTGITKRELIEQIRATLDGDKKYLKKSRRGRPYMQGPAGNILSEPERAADLESQDKSRSLCDNIKARAFMDSLKKKFYDYAEQRKKREIEFIDGILEEMGRILSDKEDK